MLKATNALKSIANIYIYIYRAALTLFLLSIPSLISLSSIVFVSSPAHAESLDYSVIIDPTLNLSLSSSTVSLNLNPVSQAFSSGNLTATVSTNNLNGYKLYITTADDATSLIRNNDGTPADSLHAVIETLPTSGSPDCSIIAGGSGGCTESNFPVNKWGYRISSGTNTNPDITDTTTGPNSKYFPYASNTLINQSSTTTNSTTATLTLAAKADYEKPAGTYELDLNFKALPQMTSYYMQDFATDPTLKDTICTEDPTMVMDKRDGHTYAIAKLKDGKCWMVQNLRLGENLESVTGSMTLTSEDSNIGEDGFTLTNKVVNGNMVGTPVSDSSATGGTGYIYDGSVFYCTEAYGCYYNWYTATASSGTSGISAQDNANYDICPKGWILPTGGTNTVTNLKSLIAEYNAGSTSDTASRLLINPNSLTENINGVHQPGFTLGGSYNISGANAVGSYSNYWARTNFSTSQASCLTLSTSIVAPTNHGNKDSGRSVRCLAQ